MRRMYSVEELKRLIKNAPKEMSSLFDASGNPRFVEGSIKTAEKEGVTYTYAKWSLSGTHLMIVICATIESGTVWNNTYFATIENLPDYIKSKIIPVWANEFILQQKFSAFDNSWNAQELNITLAKQQTSPNNLYLYQPGNVTFATTKNIRIELDLLVDAQ